MDGQTEPIMNTEDKINARGILTPSDHPLSSSLKRVFQVDPMPQFRELLKALIEPGKTGRQSDLAEAIFRKDKDL